MSDRVFDVIVLERFCKGCGLCVEVCREGKLKLRAKPDRRGIRTCRPQPDADCTGCLRCATICPDAALEVTRTDQPVGSCPGSASDG